MPFSVETFGAGHALISNHVPPQITLEQVARIQEPTNLEVNKYGLFEASSPDFNKYYPDVTAKDLKPEEADFAYPIFRALSKIIISKYGPVDFSAGTVLEDSAHLLVGQAVLTNHEQIVGNEVGVVSEAFFQGAKTVNGYKIPAGINVKMKLDGKSNPKLVRSIMMEPPSVHSSSVTVAFAWEQSHKSLTAEDFYRLLGSLDDKGKLIRRMVTEIVRYDEISLVSHGADPFAQRIKDGKIANPEYATKRYQFMEGEHRAKYHFMDWKELGTNEATFSLDDTIPSPAIISSSNQTNKTNVKPEPMNEQLLILLRAQLGLAADATEALVTAKLQEQLPLLVSDRASLGQVRTELAQTKETLTALQARLPEGSTVITKEEKQRLDSFDSIKAVHDLAMTATKAECLKLYHLSVGGADKADASIAKLIAEASFESLTALVKQYQAAVEKSFTATCKSCGSHDITRASSSTSGEGVVIPGQSEGGNNGGGNNTPVAKTTDEALSEIVKKANSFSLKNIHGELKK